jgi:hypothetical protein
VQPTAVVTRATYQPSGLTLCPLGVSPPSWPLGEVPEPASWVPDDVLVPLSCG